MIKVDECEPIGELEAKFPYRDVQIKRGVDVNEYYDLEAEIGRGKFGTVYLCREKATSLSLAAKFVGIKRRQDRRNVEREVEIMRTLQHPRLIQLYDAFESDSTMVVVLELIEGGELFERVIGDDFILTEKACTIFMRQICEGVAFIHKNNIIHLDLKPENILCLTKTGNRIKIIDFGLARHYEPGSKLQVLFGTPEFVAPEVVNFDQISPATDMWSVGVICYVLLSGLSPFMGDTDVETMTNVTLSRYDYEDESFDSISENAKDFITNLLLNNKESRLTADQCLEHPWLRKRIPPPPPELITTKENLKSFVDNYHNINVLAENNVDDIINRKPSALSAVELIAASDKEFLNRDGVKSFSNMSNENILPPVRIPVVVTNNNVVPATIDNNLSVISAPNTNDEVLNMVNANISSMPSPPVLDNASAMVPNIPVVSNNVPNLNQIVQMENEIENNNILVADTFESDVEREVENLSTSLPLADVPPRVIAAPDVPVAHLPFISKSLPAAAAMLGESMVDQLKPLHIPLIPSLSVPEDIDEPIIVHPPVIGTTLPPKRGSVDVDSIKLDIENIESLAAGRGSIDVISLIPKRGSIDVDKMVSKRDLIGVLSQSPKRDSIQGLPPKHGSFEQNTVIPSVESMETETPSLVTQPTPLQSPTPMYQTQRTELPIFEPPLIVASPSIEILEKNICVPKEEVRIASTAPQSLPIALSAEVVPTPPEQPKPYVSAQQAISPESIEEVFVPQPPPVVKILSTSPVSPPITPPSTHEIITQIQPLKPQPSTSFQTPYEPAVLPNRPIPYTPSPPPKAPTSPVTANVISTPRRESPLQKTLDEIPKISSEILSSFTNMPSLSKTTTHESSKRKTSLGATKRSTTESSTYSSYERVSTPRVVSFTEHKTSSYTASVPPKTLPKIQGISLGRTQSEDISAYAKMSGKGYSSTVKRSEVKEIETSRQSKNETLTRTEMKNAAETEAPGFKTRLRSTAPWFSERKAESEKNLEKRSTDMSALLKETLGPLELRSPWAREIRQISAKLVELSNDTTARKQQEEEHMMEMNKQQARRQKFKVSVLNRDVVFGAAREFYIGGEVPVGSPPLREQLLGKPGSPQTGQSRSTTRSPRLSPDERKSKPSFRTTAK